MLFLVHLKKHKQTVMYYGEQNEVSTSTFKSSTLSFCEVTGDILQLFLPRSIELFLLFNSGSLQSDSFGHNLYDLGSSQLLFNTIPRANPLTPLLT